MAAGVSFLRHRWGRFLVSLAVAPVTAGLVTGVAPASAAVRPPVACL
jgi:hypothetical protein